MFHNSAWLLCALLLCIGHTLSEDVKDKVVDRSGKPVPPSSHQEIPNQVPNDQMRDTNDPAATGATNSVKETKNPLPKTNTSGESMSTPTSPPPKPTPTPISTSKPTEPATPKTTSTSAPTAPPTKPTSPTPPSPPSTTPIPVTPKPGPQKGTWSVQNYKNVTCLKIEGIFAINYAFNGTEKAHFDVPVRAEAHGTCKEKEGTIALTWKNAINENRLEFIFIKNDTTHKYALARFSGQIFIPDLNRTKPFNTDNREIHFETPVNQSYSCSLEKQIVVNNDTKVTLQEFHLQAFKTSNTTGFDASVDCTESSQHTPDIVPIIVGCVLALLVIAVLVAYLISRRRSQTRGYLSM